MSNAYEIISLKISDLNINIGNPRFEPVSTQHEAIEIIIEDQKDKIVALVTDILEEGLNPSDLPIVTPDDTQEGKYVVLEGNRRMTALKILLEPNLIPKRFGNIAKKIENLKKEILT